MYERRWHKAIKVALMLALVMVLVPALLLVATPVAASPDDSGWHSPSAYENNNSWVNPTYAYTSDDNRMDANSNGDTITLYNFNFSGISGTVNGIEVDVEAMSSGPQASGVRIRLMYNGRSSETDYKQTPNLTTSEAYYTLGSSTDTWGRSWTGNDFTDANFAVRVIAYKPSAHHPLVDHVRVRVYYTPNWESYESDYSTIDDLYDTGGDIIYMKGTGFAAGTYIVRYYDADGTQMGTDANLTIGAGEDLTSQMACNTNPSATAGTWHAKAYLSDGTTLIADDTFTVTSGAIPEFPTVITAIVVAGLCFGIYYWMRKRRLGYAEA